MTNVVSLDAGPKPCPYCGAKRACPDFTCPRIAILWHCEADGEWEITFHDDWQKTPPEGDEAA